MTDLLNRHASRITTRQDALRELTEAIELGEEVSDLAIDTLRSEAAEAGDMEAVALCERALRGDGLARARCAAAVRAVLAAADPEE